MTALQVSVLKFGSSVLGNRRDLRLSVHEIYRELRRRYPLPRVQMTCSYAIAMLYTRFNEPRDHDAALEWVNNARALCWSPTPSRPPTSRSSRTTGRADRDASRRSALARACRRRDRAARANCRRTGTSCISRSCCTTRAAAALGRLDERRRTSTGCSSGTPIMSSTHRCAPTSRAGGGPRDRAGGVRPRGRGLPPPDLFHNRATVRTQAGWRATRGPRPRARDEPDTLHARLARGAARAGDAAGALADAHAGRRPARPRRRTACSPSRSAAIGGAPHSRARSTPGSCRRSSTARCSSSSSATGAAVTLLTRWSSGATIRTCCSTAASPCRRRATSAARRATSSALGPRRRPGLLLDHLRRAVADAR